MSKNETINFYRESGFRNSLLPQTSEEYELTKETIDSFLANNSTITDTVTKLAGLFYELLPTEAKKRVENELRYKANLFEKAASMPKELKVATPFTVFWNEGFDNGDYEVSYGDTLYLHMIEIGYFFYCQKYKRKVRREVYENGRYADVYEEEPAYRKVFPLSAVQKPKKGFSKLEEACERRLRWGNISILPKAKGEEILLVTPEAWGTTLHGPSSFDE